VQNPKGAVLPSLEPASLSPSGFGPEARIFQCQAPDFVRYSQRRLIGSTSPASHCHHCHPSISRSPRCHSRSATCARDKTLGRLQNKTTTREKQAMSAGLATPVAESTPPLAPHLSLTQLIKTGFVFLPSYRKSKCNGVRPVCKTCQESGHEVRERSRFPRVFLH